MLVTGARPAANWVGYNNFGNTTNLNDGADAKSELWYRMVVEDFLLNDHLNPTDYVHTDAGCIGENSLADYFAPGACRRSHQFSQLLSGVYSAVHQPSNEDLNQTGTTRSTQVQT